MKSILKKASKALIFCLIFMVLFTQSTKILGSTEDPKNYQFVAGFYTEEDDTLDAVYVGSSTVYAYWNSMISWSNYGLAIRPYTCAGMPYASVEYVIKEARKSQPDALYIININTFLSEKYDEYIIHYLADYMPFSFNKMAMIYDVAKTGGYTLAESMEFYFPIIKYHSRWSELTEKDFDFELNNLKGSGKFDLYLKTTKDITKKYVRSTKAGEVAPGVKEALDSLFEYINKENINVLFTTVPQARATEKSLMEHNAVEEYVASAGYKVLSFMNNPEQMDIDITKDYYNARHANIHGSIKYTAYLSEYLIENYNFSNKRGLEEYKSWDDAVAEYTAIIDDYALDVEYNCLDRDYSLGSVKDLSLSFDGKKARLSWKGTAGADGYAVYRKGSYFKQLALTDGESFVDDEIKVGSNYRYIVVPYYEADGKMIYGDFDYYGVRLETK